MKDVTVTTTITVDDSVETTYVAKIIEEMLSDVTQADGFETTTVESVADSKLPEGIASLPERIDTETLYATAVTIQEVTQDGPEN